MGPAAYEGVGAAAACWPKQRAALAAPPPPPPPRRRLETTTTAAAASALGAPLAPPCCSCCWRLFLSPWVLVSLTSSARLLLMLGQVGETASSQDMEEERKEEEMQAPATGKNRRRESLIAFSLSPPQLVRLALLRARGRRGGARHGRGAREDNQPNVRLVVCTLAAAENEKPRERE